MDRTPRSTIVLALLLAALLIALTVFAVVHPRSSASDVHTHIVLEMVAAMDGLVLRVAREPAAGGAEGLRLPWLLLLVLGTGLAGLCLLRRVAQQHSRSRRS